MLRCVILMLISFFSTVFIITVQYVNLINLLNKSVGFVDFPNNLSRCTLKRFTKPEIDFRFVQFFYALCILEYFYC